MESGNYLEMVVGEKVYTYDSSRFSTRIAVAEIARLTKTRIVLAGSELAYSRTTGRKVGGSGGWGEQSCIYPMTSRNDEIYLTYIMQVNRHRMIAQLNVAAWEKLTGAQLSEVYVLVMGFLGKS